MFACALWFKTVRDIELIRGQITSAQLQHHAAAMFYVQLSRGMLKQALGHATTTMLWVRGQTQYFSLLVCFLKQDKRNEMML